jgi:hypothetical protein
MGFDVPPARRLIARRRFRQPVQDAYGQAAAHDFEPPASTNSSVVLGSSGASPVPRRMKHSGAAHRADRQVLVRPRLHIGPVPQPTSTIGRPGSRKVGLGQPSHYGWGRHPHQPGNAIHPKLIGRRAAAGRGAGGVDDELIAAVVSALSSRLRLTCNAQAGVQRHRIQRDKAAPGIGN